jgi:AraC-like DNA-binding protein
MASVPIGWLQVIALLGAIQGVFLAAVLATKRTNRSANRLLAATMLTFSVYLATSPYHAGGYVSRWPHFFGAAFPLPFLFGPLIYLYAVTAADRHRGLRRLDALHLVPFLATVIVGLPIYMMSGAEKIAFYEGLQRGIAPGWFAGADLLKLVSGVAYSTATIVFLRRHRERVKESYSSTERVNLRWLLVLSAATACIWSMAVVFRVLESVNMRFAPGDDLITLAMAILVYGIGYMGLRQPEIFRFETAEFPVPTRDAPIAEPESAAPRYTRSGLTDRQAERLKDALLNMMERDRPWQDSELTLSDLAGRLDTTPHKLSEVLNSQLGQTFYDFVNGYRVREVQRRIAAGEAQRVKMLTLALDAGFASKSTFNLVFKKFTSQTPSDYRQTAGI